jgi:hypothetical protein
MSGGGWSVAGVFAVAWVVVQVGVPTVLLALGERPTPLGWQMYSATRGFPLVWVEVEGGAPEEVELSRYVPRPRAEVDYARLLPPFLCRQIPGARWVEVRAGGSEDAPAERHACP